MAWILIIFIDNASAASLVKMARNKDGHTMEYCLVDVTR